MTSPVLSLIVPILFLIVPFMILKLQGIPITAGMYVSTLKTVFQKHHIGQLFNIKSATWDKAVYILMSFGFYLFQIYQNIMSCIKFFKNMSKIHLQLFTIRDHLVATLVKMENFEKQCKDLNLDTYKPFIADMQEKTTIMREMIAEYTQINPSTSFFSLKKISQVGHLMKCFYQLYNKKEFLDTLQYTFGFNGYLANLTGLCENIKQRNVGKWQAATKTKKEKNGKKKIAETSTSKAITSKSITSKSITSKAEAADAIFKNAYFPSLVNANPVKNSYEMNKHILITGPNAAGKTTILKTTLFNIILSQQVGYGFYETAHFNLYDSIHCYINIPDTSARDSLFQAEARRCKEILNKVMQETNKRHFCVFDELYSGTNPYEAIGSAYAFLTFLTKYPNVNFILTTHFLEVCKRLEKDLGDKIHNYHMQIDTHDINNFKYLYQLVRGISTIKGGVKVLRDLDYPVEIIDNMNRVLKDIVI
jgi:energy-coupling factor transporter ATP-binding protein EcfA2